MEVLIILVGVLSDTHIPARAQHIPEIVLHTFQEREVDLILHAGDLAEETVLYTLEDIARVEAVAGNMDPSFLQRSLGTKKILTLGNFKVGLFHGFGGLGSTEMQAQRFLIDCDCVVFGHTHSPTNRRVEKKLLFNPGSPTDKRNEERYSFGLLRIQEEIEGEILYFDR